MNKEEVENLVRYRLSKANDNLKAAQVLYEYGDFSASVNRSYYAAFTAARALLALKELDSKKHSGVISLFFLHYVKTGAVGRDVSNVLLTSKSMREDADYADYTEISQEAAGKELEKAGEFVKAISEKIGRQ